MSCTSIIVHIEFIFFFVLYFYYFLVGGKRKKTLDSTLDSEWRRYNRACIQFGVVMKALYDQVDSLWNCCSEREVSRKNNSSMKISKKSVVRMMLKCFSAEIALSTSFILLTE